MKVPSESLTTFTEKRPPLQAVDCVADSVTLTVSPLVQSPLMLTLLVAVVAEAASRVTSPGGWVS